MGIHVGFGFFANLCGNSDVDGNIDGFVYRGPVFSHLLADDMEQPESTLHFSVRPQLPNPAERILDFSELVVVENSVFLSGGDFLKCHYRFLACYGKPRPLLPVPLPVQPHVATIGREELARHSG